MHFFSQFFSEKNHNTLRRKISISKPKTLIYGAPKSGKTSLAFDYAQSANFSNKGIVYLDMKDPRICLDEARGELLKLYLEKKIELLILDRFIQPFPLPNIDSILILSDEKIEVPGFCTLECPALSFVEYVSFCAKNSSIDSLLKNFIKEGNLPQMPFLSDHQKIQTKQEILSLALGSNFSLFLKLISFQSQKFTIFQFYTLLRKTEKISKDKIYLFFDVLQARSLIFFIPHLQPTKPKKIYFYDFSIPKTLTLNPVILPILENMFVLELVSLNQKIHYDDFGRFIVSGIGNFLFMPFAQKEVIEKKLLKMPKEDLIIITLNFSSSGITNGIAWEALSFLEFTLGGIE